MKPKHYNDEVTLTNTPHLREKTIMLGLTYFFIGGNFLVHGVMYGTIDKILGIIFILLVPFVVIDIRRENRGTFAVVCACVINLCGCAFLTVTSSFWWILVFIFEIIISFLIVFLLCRVKGDSSS